MLLAPSTAHLKDMTTASGGLSSLDSITNDEVTPSSPSCQGQNGQESAKAEKPYTGEASQPYSAFTRPQKWLIILLATFAATFSPLSSFTFFPAVTALSESLHVSIARINLTITSYMIIAGVAPAVLGDLADTAGRRVVYVLMMSIYCAANIGLAVQNDWAALFVLRMAQSAGSAGSPLIHEFQAVKRPD